jgi:hypothetical protein
MNQKNLITVRLPRTLLSTALFCFFVLAYIAAPYWLVARSRVESLIFLLTTVLIGFLWTRLASGDLQFQVDRKTWITPAILLLLLGMLNFRALTSAIPWRGDESSHIAFALTLAQMIPLAWAAIAVFAFLLVLYVGWKRPKYALLACAVLAAGCVGVYILRKPPPLSPILRYPLVSRWFHALIPILFRPVTGLQQEILYRIVPLLSAVLISWQYSKSVWSRSTLIKLALGMAVATIPLVFYYSSILYLEMPAVLLMFLACNKIDQLLDLSFDDLKTNPAWYALILIGFIKETAVVFLLSFVFCRIVVRLSKPTSRVTSLRWVRDEIFVALGTLLPLAIYLFFRSYSSDPRQFHFNQANLLDLRALFVILLSYLEQFGLIFLLFFGGVFLLFRKRQYSKALFLIIIIVSSPLFHLLDTLEYAGYSRFNLFALPAVLAGSAVFVQFIGTRKKWYLPALTVLVFVANLVITPINLDGTKKPYWGNRLVDTSEHYYPFPEALSWLRDHSNPGLILFAGLGFFYYLDFYFDKLKWHPHYELLDSFGTEDASSLHTSLRIALERGASCVVFRLDTNNIQNLAAESESEPWQLKVFSNRAHSLLVYTRE